MTASGWTWADLSDDQLRQVSEAEQALGADYLLVYQPSRASRRAVAARVRRLQAAQLSESQLECLHGLEAQLQAVVVAYAGESAP